VPWVSCENSSFFRKEKQVNFTEVAIKWRSCDVLWQKVHAIKLIIALSTTLREIVYFPCKAQVCVKQHIGRLNSRYTFSFSND